MIQLIGARRVLIVGILVAINIMLAGGVYYYLGPQNQEIVRQNNQVRNQISSRQSEIRQLRSDFEMIQENKELYQQIIDTGFFFDQDRVQARRLIESLKDQTQVIRTEYSISPAEFNDYKDIDEAGYKLMMSPVSIEIEAMDDVDIYEFIYLIEYGFPGQVVFTGLEVERTRDVTEARLREIGSGFPVTLVESSMNFLWGTLVPEEEVGDIDNLTQN